MDFTEGSILRIEHHQEMEMLKASEGINDLPLPSPSQLSCNPGCAFSKQSDYSSESEQRSKAAGKLGMLIILSLIFMAVEIVGGVKANSLAVLTDAAHMLSDVAGFAISLFAVWASGWEATSQQSFGFNRLEVLGALFSVQLIWMIVGFLIYEAVDRIFHKNSKVNGKLMFAIAAFGFLVNLTMVTWLGHHHSHHACGHKDHDHEKKHNHSHHACGDKDHDHEKVELCALSEEEEANLLSTSPENGKILNINLQGAYLHLMADLIQSVGVMIAGGIIWAKQDWLLVDLVCTLIFSVLVLSTTLPMLRNIFGILMERTPHDINIARLENDLRSMRGVRGIHDLHVWAITVGKIVLSCHVVVESGVSQHEILHRIRDYCEKTYGIHHITIQIEE